MAVRAALYFAMPEATAQIRQSAQSMIDMVEFNRILSRSAAKTLLRGGHRYNKDDNLTTHGLGVRAW